MEIYSKMEIISEKSALAFISAPDYQFLPLQIKSVKIEPPNSRADAIIEMGWEGRTIHFAANYKPRLSPRIIEEFATRILHLSKLEKLPPLLLTTYASEANLEHLAQLGISALDLNGNGIITVPGTLFVLKTGRANRFTLPQQFLNPYNGATSIVSRTLLLCPEFSTAKDLLKEAQRRGAKSLTLGTISKALQALEEDLLIAKSGRSVRLIDPERLLEKLENNFQPPKITLSIEGKCSASAVNRVFAQKENTNFLLVPTGRWSAQAYSTAARFGTFQMYCSDIDYFLDAIGRENFQEEEFFPDIKLLQTTDRTVFFDNRLLGAENYTWASPIQTYLELKASRDKREKETAQQVKKAIFSDACGGNKQ